jgi:hypothetical protein
MLPGGDAMTRSRFPKRPRSVRVCELRVALKLRVALATHAATRQRAATKTSHRKIDNGSR